MKKIIHGLFLVGLTALVACKKNITDPGNSTPEISSNKIAPERFNFATSREVSFNLTLKATNGAPLKGIIVSVYNPSNTAANAAIFKGVTDVEGKLSAKISVASSVNKIIIDPAYVGLLRYAHANINSNSVTALLGGPTVFGGDIVPDAVANGTTSGRSVLNMASTGTIFTYPSPYSSTADAVLNTTSNPLYYGVPKYLEPTPDEIDPSLLTFVNASVPEGKTVPENHPKYLSNSAPSTLRITTKSDIWITFVSDGAANYNSLAFYTYETGKAPKSELDIKNATLIFPNASSLGGGGGLRPGDRVKIGTFDAGTSIGFILLSNSWTGSGINTEVTKYYSETSLNPETDDNKKRHSVVLYDGIHNLTMVGFEDVSRQTGDNDFNDLVFYARSNPASGIATTGMPEIDRGNDYDGDGVPDSIDEYPYNPEWAYTMDYPSANTWCTLAFEDNWPEKGDYDMNDLVLNYRYHYTMSSKNRASMIDCIYSIVAVGASFKNGFGIQFNVPAENVGEVAGFKNNSKYYQVTGTGVESGQSKAVVIPFDNTDDIITNPDKSYFINTKTDKYKTPNNYSRRISTYFYVAPDYALVAPDKINPFLFSNGRRDHEVHLPGFPPTDKANLKLFGAADDSSVPAVGKYYVSKENWPWAINFSSQFTYPVEGVKISDAYTHFLNWAGTGGLSYSDWYSNSIPGYRNNINLYLK
ncbi:LruC domain-containing protein [Mucilaginibacter gynuensis]|uniref:LruC domain-containing protein n=1 Tax=Mucilaginibacter gynuensis TaxID=1302236 RepID=A0ABP8FSG2_9SPHI